MLVNGNWGDWGAWSDCSANCGGGVQSRTRSCNDPVPQYGGAICDSNHTSGIDYMNGTIRVQASNKTCNENPCQSR